MTGETDWRELAVEPLSHVLETKEMGWIGERYTRSQELRKRVELLN